MASRSSIAVLVARRVRELRAARGWTQVRLAAEAGLARATVATIEAGHDVPSLETIDALAGAFDESPATMLLDPGRSVRDAAAVAVLTADDEAVSRAAEALGVVRKDA